MSGFGPEDTARKPDGITWFDGGEGFLLVEVNTSSITITAKDQGGNTKYLGTGGPAMSWTLTPNTSCSQ